MNFVKRFVNGTVYTVTQAPAYLPLPALAAAIDPGAYLFNGVGYDCSQPGRYLFWSGYGAPVICRMVYGGDLYAFLSGIAWHHIHGIEDEGLTGQALANAGMGHKWRLRCGPIADLMLWWLPLYGLTVRKVSLLTTGPLNGMDDGHIAFEVFHESKWKMWDITNGLYFRKNGVHLSAAEIVSSGVLTCERVAIDGDEKRGSSVAWDALNQPWCMSSYEDLCFRTDADKDAWFVRVFQSWSAI